MVVHCLFEQSGTFKKEFKALGYEAYDYDILNDFGQTDYVIDLFNEIEKGYAGQKSIFDNIQQNDIVLAFFPCVRFEDQIIMNFKGVASGQAKWNDLKKLEYSINLHKELADLYNLVSKLAIIALKKGFQMIIENPYGVGGQHYLTRYWPLKPKIIDKNRLLMGDDFKKPTQYWYINGEPKNNFFMFVPEERPQKIVLKQSVVERSMIHPEYARNFILKYILPPEEVGLFYAGIDREEEEKNEHI